MQRARKARDPVKNGTPGQRLIAVEKHPGHGSPVLLAELLDQGVEVGRERLDLHAPSALGMRSLGGGVSRIVSWHS
jgi:hypothetical protein